MAASLETIYSLLKADKVTQRKVSAAEAAKHDRSHCCRRHCCCRQGGMGVQAFPLVPDLRRRA